MFSFIHRKLVMVLHISLLPSSLMLLLILIALYYMCGDVLMYMYVLFYLVDCPRSLREPKFLLL